MVGSKTSHFYSFRTSSINPSSCWGHGKAKPMTMSTGPHCGSPWHWNMQLLSLWNDTSSCGVAVHSAVEQRPCNISLVTLEARQILTKPLPKIIQFHSWKLMISEQPTLHLMARKERVRSLRLPQVHAVAWSLPRPVRLGKWKTFVRHQNISNKNKEHAMTAMTQNFCLLPPFWPWKQQLKPPVECGSCADRSDRQPARRWWKLP